MREVLGVPTLGPTGIAHSVNIFFNTDLSPWVTGRSINLAMIQHPGAAGVLLALPDPQRWYFQAFYAPVAGQSSEDFTPERCASLLHAAVGVPDVPLPLIY